MTRAQVMRATIEAAAQALELSDVGRREVRRVVGEHARGLVRRWEGEIVRHLVPGQVPTPMPAQVRRAYEALAGRRRRGRDRRKDRRRKR